MRTATLGFINLIDLAIGLAALIGILNGYRRGFWMSLFQYSGMVAGVVGGAALAPALLTGLGITSASIRPFAAALVLVVAGSLGSTIGYWAGEPLRNAVLRLGIAHPPEMLAGAVFSVAAVLSVSWFLGLTLARGPSSGLAQLIHRSIILRELDTVFPRPPAFMSGAQQVLAGVPFPPTFAGLEPTVTQPVQPPASVDTPEIRVAEDSVFKVEGRGCGGVVSGSAFPVGANGYLITNAHVVSGTSGTVVSRSRQGKSPALGPVHAQVVLFDPQRDVAILYAPAISQPPLTQGSGARGIQGAVIGYPGGGDEDVQPAVIDSSTHAQGRDIYNERLVDREIWIIQASVRPGNSGGPVVDLQGHLLGLVFAASSSNPDQAYALTNAEIEGDIRQGVGSRATVDTRGLSCAV